MAAAKLGNLRSKFTYNIKDLKKWYPGHMGKGMKDMQQKLKGVDCILEVHDSRIPFSGRNPEFFYRLTAIKPHILILNKMDLSNLSYKSQILEKLKEQNISNVIFTNCKDHQDKGIKEILPRIISLIKSSDRYHRSENYDYSIMVIGVPNVGKSSLINALRNRFLRKAKATQVGALAGVTRSVLERIKMSEEPPVYLLDTPGILTPTVKNVDVALRLALCATIKDSIIGEEIIADYLLYWLNKHQKYSYVEYLGLKEPSDDISRVLFMTALNLDKKIALRSVEGGMIIRPDTQAAAIHFLKGFREGSLGNILLDEDMLASVS